MFAPRQSFRIFFFGGGGGYGSLFAIGSRFIYQVSCWFPLYLFNRITINNMGARLNFSDKIVCSFHLWKMNKWWKRISHERKINTICQQTYKTGIQIELIVLSIYPLLCIPTLCIYFLCICSTKENWSTGICLETNVPSNSNHSTAKQLALCAR